MDAKSRPRMLAPWVAVSMVLEGEAARMVALGAVASDDPKAVRLFVQPDAVQDAHVRDALLSPDPSFREVLLSGALPFHEAYTSLGAWIVEHRGFVLFDPPGRQLGILEREFPVLGLSGISFADSPKLEVYRSVSAHAKARPTLERLIQENLGVKLSRGREAILSLWKKGDTPAALEGLKEDVSGLFRLLDLGLKRGVVKLDGKPIAVDWDRRLRGLQRAASGGAGGP